MIFYDCSTAPSPRRARMFIAEKGLEIETRNISIADGEQFSEDFLKINQRATLPVLVTDEGSALTENTAIAAYLEARFPEPPLLGRDPDEKGRVAMWNTISEQQGGTAVAEAFRNAHPAMKGRALPGPLDLEQIPELAERGRRRVEAFFALLEARLQQSPWLAGDAFSMADITAFVFTDFARVIRARIPEDNEATQAWFGRVKTRPSASL
ncbi:glutathione S-transferase family protein [Marimonas arenosa]|uniref:Glutathione S-transferase n=1 Tax=Marimonas arenosa TaxID=1795305 RepID=A0AAE3WF73_9RHOB|nr:glutathione S-transferase [Marimonas arenosa]MDQ2091617.1 glutathione S-transferase [Marimonas arenosa]